MKIYEIEADYDHYDTCTIDLKALKIDEVQATPELFFHLKGSRVADTWWPRPMERRHKWRHKLGDFICSLNPSAMILEYQAIEKLRSVLGDIEILPLLCPFGDYRCVNVLGAIDCLDYEKSEYSAFDTPNSDGTPRIMMFKKYAFIPERLSGHHIFRLVNTRVELYADDVFVEEVTKHGITGFKFKLLWEG